MTGSAKFICNGHNVKFETDIEALSVGDMLTLSLFMSTKANELLQMAINSTGKTVVKASNGDAPPPSRIIVP